ncbi:ARM repeat-containing protein [Atractiella rhizophila]|nr:ARM repeat-containing protein [Atractiella rhizophila]
MSKKVVTSWLETTEPDDEDRGGQDEELEDAMSDWDSFAGSHLPRDIRAGRTGKRRRLLELLISRANRDELSPKQISDVLKVLLAAYNLPMKDGDSRRLLRDFVEAVLSDHTSSKRETSGTPEDERAARIKLWEMLEKWLDNTVTRNNEALAGSIEGRLSLLAWSLVLLSTSPTFPKTPKSLLNSITLLFNSLILYNDDTAIPKRTAVQREMKRQLRHFERLLRQNETVVNLLLEDTLSSSNISIQHAPFLGFLLKQKSISSEPLSLAQASAAINFLTTHIFGSKLVLNPATYLTLFDGIFSLKTKSLIQFEAHKDIFPTIEKALLRSPEIVLPICFDFFSRLITLGRGPEDIGDIEACRLKLAPRLLECSKSANPVVRTSVIKLYNIFFDAAYGRNSYPNAFDGITVILKTGKTASPEHRQTLLEILNTTSPIRKEEQDVALNHSAILVDTAVTVLARESNDFCLRSLAAILGHHLSVLLDSRQEKCHWKLSQDQVAVLAKVLKESKKHIWKGILIALLGRNAMNSSRIRDSQNVSLSSHKVDLLKDLLPIMDTTLKPVYQDGFLMARDNWPDIFIVLFILLSVSNAPELSKIPDVSSRFVKPPLSPASLLSIQPKPSILLNERVWKKVLGEQSEEEMFLSTLAKAIFLADPKALEREKVRPTIGMPLVHLALLSPHYANRQMALDLISQIILQNPRLGNSILGDGLREWLLQYESSPVAFLSLKEDDDLPVLGPRLNSILSRISQLSPSVQSSEKEELLLRWIIVANHPLIGGKSSSPWIEMLQTAGLSPSAAIQRNIDRLLEILWSTEREFGKQSQWFRSAVFRAAGFLALAAPEVAVPKFVETVISDLTPDKYRFAGSEECGIWLTPDGTTYVDVLSSKQTNSSTTKDQKQKALEEWEAEIRRSVAQKKPQSTTAVSLSKADQALVKAQLVKESQVRERVDNALRTVLRAFSVIDACVETNPESLKPTYRIACAAFVGHLSVGNFPIDRKPSILYVSSHIYQGGQGLGREATDEAYEQITLAVDFISFHGRSCSNSAFPRVVIIQTLIKVLSTYPQLVRTANAALEDVASASKENASNEEIEVLLQSSATDHVQALDLTDLTWSPELWILCHDSDSKTKQAATEVWEENGLDVPAEEVLVLVKYLESTSAVVRDSAAHSIATAVTLYPEQVDDVLTALVGLYQVKNKPLGIEYDKFGMVIEASLDRQDPWKERRAIALSLGLLASSYTTSNVRQVFSLLLKGDGLGDRNEEVRKEMLTAASAIIDAHGKAQLQELIATFEAHLQDDKKSSATSDHVTEGVVILFGRLARHLEAGDPRVAMVTARLLEALRTPSEIVQNAVSACLPPLVPDRNDESTNLVETLLRRCLSDDTYAERRGAAYGLAGAIKGRGVSTIKELDLISRLKVAAEDKKTSTRRQGAIFAFEIMSEALGRDAAKDVQEATQAAANIVMRGLSGHGVKLILPSLLDALDEKQWRPKKGAIDLMGSMANLAPRQLAESLPTIIPKLTAVLTDTHKAVKEAANKSLKRLGDVITSPEIRNMQNILLDALVDPTKKTAKALETLLTTTFVHYIDGPALALVIPILDRGLKERSSEIKRKSSQIVGQIASLTEADDIAAYLNELVPRVREVLVDPVPEARATAAKAFGSLVERLGEEKFPDLLDSLLAVLKSDASGVDQQGAAQGVSEILAGLGLHRLEEMLPSIIENTANNRPYVREGYMSLLVFLPATFGDRFSPYLASIIPPVLSGLADDSENVREASMRCGRMIVSSHSNRAVELLLPELENQLFSENWRIRHSSVQLLGDLLFRLSGISGKAEMDTEEDVEDSTVEPSKKALLDALGKERRDKVLASLFIVRQDSVGVIRQAAIHVWKALVSNTPRTIRDILRILMQLLIRSLANSGREQRQTAARCMGETCRKLGEVLMREVIAILQKALQSDSAATREGACLALAELMANVMKSQLEPLEDDIIACIRGALVDGEPTVRVAAAKAFDLAQVHIGSRSIDETIPTLLEALRQPGGNSEAALAALREVMEVRSTVIFPVLLPTLLARPISAFNARALASLVTVAGPALTRRISDILDALKDELSACDNEETKRELNDALSAVLSSVQERDALYGLMMHLLGLAKSNRPEQRVIGCQLFKQFCQVASMRFSQYRVDWIRQLVSLFGDAVATVVEEAWNALDELVKRIPKEEMNELVSPLRRTIEGTGTPGVDLPGFCRPNGLKPVLPILLQALLTGTPEQREQAALGLGDVVERTSEGAIKAFVVQLTGPLIRIIGDRFPAPVKTAILNTLTSLLQRVPAFVRPFFPQLQRTFLKNLSDPASAAVRSASSRALGVLMRLGTPNAVVTELTASARGAEEGEEDIGNSLMNGLAEVVKNGGEKMNEQNWEAVMGLLDDTFTQPQSDGRAAAAARLFASVAAHKPDSLVQLLQEHILLPNPPTPIACLSIQETVETAPKAFYDLNLSSDIVATVVRNGTGNQPHVISTPTKGTIRLMRDTPPWADDNDVLDALN